MPPETIDSALLTHAHLDHSGYIPALVRDGFRGKIICTPATAVLSVLRNDAAAPRDLRSRALDLAGACSMPHPGRCQKKAGPWQ